MTKKEAFLKDLAKTDLKRTMKIINAIEKLGDPTASTLERHIQELKQTIGESYLFKDAISILSFGHLLKMLKNDITVYISTWAWTLRLRIAYVLEELKRLQEEEQAQ